METEKDDVAPDYPAWEFAMKAAADVVTDTKQKYGPDGGWHKAATVLMRALPKGMAGAVVEVRRPGIAGEEKTTAYVWPLDHPDYFGLLVGDGSTHIYKVLAWKPATVEGDELTGGNDIVLIEGRHGNPLFPI